LQKKTQWEKKVKLAEGKPRAAAGTMEREGERKKYGRERWGPFLGRGENSRCVRRESDQKRRKGGPEGENTRVFGRERSLKTS